MATPRSCPEAASADAGRAAPDGIKLTPFDWTLADQMKVAERVMRKDRNVLRKLSEN